MDFSLFKEVFESSKMDFILSHAMYCRDVLKLKKGQRAVISNGRVRILFWDKLDLKLDQWTVLAVFPEASKLTFQTESLFSWGEWGLCSADDNFCTLISEEACFCYKCSCVKPSHCLLCPVLCIVTRVWCLSENKLIKFWSVKYSSPVGTVFIVVQSLWTHWCRLIRLFHAYLQP